MPYKGQDCKKGSFFEEANFYLLAKFIVTTITARPKVTQMSMLTVTYLLLSRSLPLLLLFSLRLRLFLPPPLDLDLRSPREADFRFLDAAAADRSATYGKRVASGLSYSSQPPRLGVRRRELSIFGQARERWARRRGGREPARHHARSRANGAEESFLRPPLPKQRLTLSLSRWLCEVAGRSERERL